MIVVTTNSSDNIECDVSIEYNDGSKFCNVAEESDQDCVQVENGKIHLQVNTIPKV